jgi:O-acetyl-ADP-ribose deacetylase (regulator of RNase III)
MMQHVVIHEGSLLDSKDQYLAHQTNCISKRAAHLADEVFAKYPYANVYSKRTSQDEPGTIIISGNGNDERYVINMMGQVYPGKPKYSESATDGYRARYRYFFLCLKAISKIDNLQSIAFPWQIGCGAAGGNWEDYYNLLNKFAKHLSGKVEVKIYRLPDDDHI